MTPARNWTTSVCLLLAWAATPAFSQTLGETTTARSSAVLDAIPDDAWAVVCMPNIQRFEKKLTTLGQQLQVPMMSPLGMAKMMTGIMAGFDDAGGLAIALMPTNNLGAVAQSVVVFLPVTDYDALLAQLSPEPADGGMSKIFFMEKETYAAPVGKFAAFAQDSETLAKVLASKKSLHAALAAHRLTRIERDDLTIWLNLKAITGSELYDGFAGMLAKVGMDPDLFRQFNSAAVSLHLDPAGVTLGLHADADPASEIGRGLIATKGTSKSLLTGLPKDEFIVALGATISEAAGKQTAAMMEQMLKQSSAQAGDHQQLVETLGALAINLIGDVRHVSASVSPISAGSDGMISLTAVITTDGAASAIQDTVRKTLDTIKQTVAAGTAGDEQEKIASVLELFTFKTAVEELDGVSVDHFSVTLPSEIPADDAKKIAQVLGKDGVLVRFASIDDNRVAVTLGGGADRMKQVIAAAKAGAAPLADDEGIRKVAALLPKERNWETYICFDRAIKAAARISKVVGADFNFPGAIPHINAPLAIVAAPSGKAGSQTEIFLPTELIVAIKDIAMAQAVAGPPPANPPPGGGET